MIPSVPVQRGDQTSADDRPRPLKVFLGGPIQHLLAQNNSPSVVASHKEIVEALKAAGFEVLSAHVIEEYGETSADFSPEHVTVRDFAWVEECDVYVAVLPLDADGTPYRTDGTHIEIGWATALSKRTILLVSDAAVQPYGHLVRGLIHIGRVEMVPIEKWRDELMLSLGSSAHTVLPTDKRSLSAIARG